VEGSASKLVQFALVALSSIFFLVDPIAAVPTFLAMTAAENEAERRRTARRAALTCFVVLTLFALAGALIFQLFGITLPAFKIAGGIILLLIGLEMLQARRSLTKETPPETEAGLAKEDAGIIPMGVPMLAGPGAISAVMVFQSQSGGWIHSTILFLAIAITAAASYLILAAGSRVSRMMGETGIRIMMRMMGLLLTAIAVQFMVNGLSDLGLIGRK
jgi:multiple antibiotic resistance protein